MMFSLPEITLNVEHKNIHLTQYIARTLIVISEREIILRNIVIREII